MKTMALFSAVILFLSGSASAATVDTTQEGPLRMHWMDPKVSPQDDFYAYANGAWKRNNPIPSDYSSWGAFNILSEKIQKIIHAMLIKASNDASTLPGSLMQKVGDFYYSGMDLATIDSLGVSPLKNEFARIDTMTAGDLVHQIAHLQSIGVSPFFNFGSMQDFKNSQQIIASAEQGGLGLPDRDYYLKDDPKFQKIREGYVHHIGKMFELLGDSPDKALQSAKKVMAIETALAQASMSQVALRDPYAVYHIMNTAQLNKITPNFSWTHYLQAIDRKKIKHINMATPNFFKSFNEQLKTLALEDIKAYLRWHLIDAYAPFLSRPFVEQNFKLVSMLSGTPQILPRWKRVVGAENSVLGFAIGKLYVEQHFSAQSKQEVLDIMKNIRAALLADLSTVKWMSQPTREAAIKKLHAMEERIGYPTKWWDYSKLKIDRGPYVLNILRSNQFLVNRDLNKIGKPVDRSEWAMTPQTINAYYDSSMNNLNLPAGILQPPFFDPKAPASVNYGSLGFIMGHEMTHGFDDQGAQFDAKGNLKNWWTPQDLERFKKATECIATQFSKYTVTGNLPVQGKLVVGEATADLGGLTLAYKAFKQSKEYKTAKVINGLTPDQQFFLGAAQVWANNMRPEQERNLVTTDPHPPVKYRVNGTFANMPQFQQAFSIPGTSPMVNKNRCEIW